MHQEVFRTFHSPFESATMAPVPSEAQQDTMTFHAVGSVPPYMPHQDASAEAFDMLFGTFGNFGVDSGLQQALLPHTGNTAAHLPQPTAPPGHHQQQQPPGNSCSSGSAGGADLGIQLSHQDHELLGSAVSAGEGGSGGASGGVRKTASRRGGRTAEEKAQAVQEKNRRAQKRFRDRQKEKMRTMEEQVDLLTAQVARLSADNRRLVTTSSVMEKVIKLRDEQIEVFQNQVQVGGMPAHAPLPFLSSRLGPTSGSKDPCSAITPASAGAAPAAASQAAMGGVSPTNAEEVYQQWRLHVQEMANLLVEYEVADGEAKEQLAEKILRTVCTAGQLCMVTATFSPLTIKRMVAGLVGGAGMGCSAPDVVWEPVLASLELTPPQVEEITRLLQLYRTRQQHLLNERRRLAAAMQGAATATFAEGGMRAVSQDLVKQYELSAALTANLREEHNTSFTFIGTLYKKVLTPMQLAKVLVHAYPVYPDTMSLATAIARAHNKLDAAAPAAAAPGQPAAAVAAS